MVAISLELDFRPVLRFDKKSLMGAGRARLLREIKSTSSLATAAKNMGMSYRHAWGIIQHMEEICGEKLVKSKRGGSGFGETQLTSAGERFLSEFENKSSALNEAYEKSFEKPGLTTDGILLMDNKILLVMRKHEPFKGMHALPGGFVEYGERLEDCVVREVKEETGLKVKVERLFGVFSDPGRDPRGHIVSAVFILSLDGGQLSDSDETIATWVPLNNLPKLAFDHSKIVADYLKGLKKGR